MGAEKSATAKSEAEMTSDDFLRGVVMEKRYPDTSASTSTFAHSIEWTKVPIHSIERFGSRSRC
jgi:hypothetical protein